MFQSFQAFHLHFKEANGKEFQQKTFYCRTIVRSIASRNLKKLTTRKNPLNLLAYSYVNEWKTDSQI